MPLMRIKDIRDMDSDARLDKLDELNTELVRLKTMVRAGGTVENPTRLKELRRTIARLYTVESEEKLGIRAKVGKEKEKTKRKAKESKSPKTKAKPAEEVEGKPTKARKGRKSKE